VTRSRIAVALAVLGVAFLFFVLDLGSWLTLDALKGVQGELEAARAARPVGVVALYMLVYVVATALSIPGAVILTLAGGALFGVVLGTVVVSFASTLGATLAFLLARFLFREPVQRRFGASLAAVNAGVERDGVFYLFLLRLVPVFPFFVINLVMALTPMRALPFYAVSQLGMLPGTLVYVNAGTQLARIDSPQGLLSPELLAAFALLGVFPFLARGVGGWLRRRRALAGWTRPKHFDRNLIVIGAGAAGLVTAYIAAAVRARVTLIERDAMGGDCLNTGCVPSKALLRTARFVHDVRRHEALGVGDARLELRFPEVMARVHRVIETIAPHDSEARYEGLGVDVVRGHARITSPWSVEVEGRTLTARHLVVATGAEPVVPPIPGLAEMDPRTSESLWSLAEDPGRLLVLGGGPIGCELAQGFARLGVPVTLVEQAPRCLPREDPDVSEVLEEALRSDGVTLRLGATALRFETVAGERQVVLGTGEGAGASAPIAPDRTPSARIPFDTVLVAVGRRARTEGFGLETVGVSCTPDGRIEVDETLRTRVPTILAAGDCVGPHLYTHAASHQAWHAAVNALFENPFKRFAVDLRFLPHVTYTDPEVARIGLDETTARARGIAVEVTRISLAGSDRWIADEARVGFVKVLTAPGKDRILGATLVGAEAGELLAPVALAMKHGIGLGGILSTILPYPTRAEALKAVAGTWKRAHAPEGALRWVARYHRWRRNESGART
jgi:pyruvate/2-oxoglutarate dehydrogenase complex dihydrolipoamide dehydrogenase (E3) component/uncharacterized membrane protein YdjX (TVP38/TMEM64 family)